MYTGKHNKKYSTSNFFLTSFLIQKSFFYSILACFYFVLVPKFKGKLQNFCRFWENT